ncbi:Protoporphyrinogen oxidase [Sphingobium faniae]|nr:Protoporphyrinogen oxidase [Sphingobium faniae]
MKDHKIIVIGAGAAGLTAAFRLQQAGFEVLVLEASDRAGGRVWSRHQDGYIMDVGADGNSTGYHSYLALAKEVGLASAISPISSTVGTVVRGKIKYMDVASKLSLAMTSTFSLATKVKLQRGMKKIAPDLEGIDFRYLYRSAHLDDPNRSAESYGLRHFGPEATDYMIDPLSRLMQSTGADLTSILDVAAGLAFADDGVWTFLGGADRLLKTLADMLPIRFECRVEDVQEQADGALVRYRNADGDLIEEECAACVVALMYKDAVRIYPKLRDISAEFADNLQYMRSNKVHLGYSRRPDTKAWTIQMPTVEDSEIFLLFLDHNKAPDRAPEGHSLFNVQTDSKFYPQAARMTDEEAIGFARAKVEKYFPELVGHFNGVSNIERWPHIGHLNTPGYYRRAAKFVERLNEDSRVQVAGDMFSKASQETSARRGEDVANTIIRLWQR